MITLLVMAGCDEPLCTQLSSHFAVSPGSRLVLDPFLGRVAEEQSLVCLLAAAGIRASKD